MTLIKNARILTMLDTGEIPNGFILIENGKIKQVGDMEYAPPADNIIDANGAYVTPGLIDAHSHIGMWEDGIDFEGADGNEEYEPNTPQLRAIDAVNPMDRAFSEALSAGVTSVITGPGSANPIGGQILAMKTFGKCVDNMIIKEPLAIKLAFGENPKSSYSEKSQVPSTRMAIAAQIREAFFKAKEYLERIEKHKSDPDEDLPEYDMKSDILLKALKREIQVHAHVHRADDIFTAIRIAKEFNLDLVLVHATEGHLIKEYLKDYPVLSGPHLTDRSKPELKNMTEGSGAILTQSGVKTAIITDHPETPQKFLPLCAAIGMKNGLSRLDALRAITYIPAEICGVSDRIGSIKAGLDADLVIWRESPLDITASPDKVIVNGEICNI